MGDVHATTEIFLPQYQPNATHSQLTQQTNLKLHTCDHLTHCIALPLKHLYWFNISIVIMDMIILYYYYPKA